MIQREYAFGHARWHIVSGRTSEGELHTFCGRGFSVRFFPSATSTDRPSEEEICAGCRKGADDALNDAAARGGPLGGIPITSPALGTGRRYY